MLQISIWEQEIVFITSEKIATRLWKLTGLKFRVM